MAKIDELSFNVKLQNLLNMLLDYKDVKVVLNSLQQTAVMSAIVSVQQVSKRLETKIMMKEYTALETQLLILTTLSDIFKSTKPILEVFSIGNSTNIPVETTLRFIQILLNLTSSLSSLGKLRLIFAFIFKVFLN